MWRCLFILAAIAAFGSAAPAVADDGARIRALEEKVKALEERLAGYETKGEYLDGVIDAYLADTGAEPGVFEVLSGEGGKFVESGFSLSLTGQLWLFHNVPASDLGFDLGRERTDMDYIYLKLAGETGPYGFRTWFGFRESPRYTDQSPWGKFWMYETLVYGKLPTVDFDGDGKAHETTVEVGKVFVPFGIEWDHTWYGSILYYKGVMCEGDWGARATGTIPLGEGLSADYGLAFLTRSDELDGASSVSGFGLEGTSLQSPEFTDDTTSLEREQRDQWVARLALKADLGGGVSTRVGGSVLGGRIRQSVNDASARFQTGGFAGSRRQRDTEVDVQIVWKEVDLGLLVVPQAEILFENVWYDRGPANQSGRAYLAELFLKLYEDRENPYFRTIEVWYNYSADKARSQPDAFMHLPSLGMQLNERTRFMVEYVSWRTSDFVIDRGLYFHLGFDF